MKNREYFCLCLRHRAIVAKPKVVDDTVAKQFKIVDVVAIAQIRANLDVNLPSKLNK